LTCTSISPLGRLKSTVARCPSSSDSLNPESITVVPGTKYSAPGAPPPPPAARGKHMQSMCNVATWVGSRVHPLAKTRVCLTRSHNVPRARCMWRLVRHIPISTQLRIRCVATLEHASAPCYTTRECAILHKVHAGAPLRPLEDLRSSQRNISWCTVCSRVRALVVHHHTTLVHHPK
jgi:hypothetical protein